MIIWYPYQALTLDKLYAILALRTRVFVVEQNCSYNDLDYKDQVAWHGCIEKEGKLIAYVRIYEKEQKAIIGRVLVDSSSRSKGLATKLIIEAEKKIVNSYIGCTHIALDAQCYLQAFYQKQGYIPVGAEFEEDGIMHIRMEKVL